MIAIDQEQTDSANRPCPADDPAERKRGHEKPARQTTVGPGINRPPVRQFLSRVIPCRHGM
ncbi:hypothetical protein, partial [Streptomyces fuscichromogenes]|uniref:hypothetical protein n=1 Tax=Streptomyces fuscichromogenes TaxID=1324013 RepID=UPI001E5C1647